MAPEAAEDRVVIGPEQAVPLREQHAGAGIKGIIDAPRPLHGEALRIGVAPRVHIGVAYLAPEMWRALFHRSHELGHAKRIGKPLQLDAVFLLELEQPLVGDKGVRALVVGVDAYARLFHAASRCSDFSWSDFLSADRNACAFAIPGVCRHALGAKHMLLDLG